MISDRRSYLKIVMFLVLSVFLTDVTFGANADGPSWDNNINSNGRVMEEEVGNYNISEFNSDLSKLVFDLEDPGDTYPAIGEALDSILLHSSYGSPIDKRIYFDAVSPYGRLMDNADANNASSGEVYLVYNSGNQSEVTIHFADYYGAHAPAYGVGFVMSRIVADVTVTLYDSFDSVIYSDVISGNSGVGMSKFSFFGYAGSKDIDKIVLEVSSLETNQYYIDDFALITEAVAECPGPDEINSNCQTMQDEVGNYDIASFNSNPDVVVFDFDDPGGEYPASGDQVATLTEPNSGMVVTFDTVLPWGRIMNDSADRQTSGDWSLTYNTGTSLSATIRFSQNLDGVGLALMRIYGDYSITLYDVDDHVIETYTVPANTDPGSEFSWFGYYEEKSGIRKMVIDSSLQTGSQWWLDDLAVVVAPPLYQQGEINSNNVSVEDQAGNYGIDEFNANPMTVLLDFDDPWGIYPGPGSQVANISLNDIDANSANVLVMFDTVLPYGRIMDNAEGRQSSGEWSLAYNTRDGLEAVIRFNKPVYGAGFMVGRIFYDCPVTVYGQNEFGNDVEIASYTVVANTDPGSEFSWFGYYNYQAPEVTKLVIDTTLQEGSQWWLDDVAVVAELPCSDNAIAGDINKDCVVDYLDLQIMAYGWLECNPNYSGCEQ